VAVYKVLYARGADGVNVATLPEAVYATVPATAVEPGPASVKVVALIVLPVIASLKVDRTAWAIGTFVALFLGRVKMTVGAVGAGTVMKLHT
jgi:hypothetical protein